MNGQPPSTWSGLYVQLYTSSKQSNKNTIFTRLSLDSKVAINHLLSAEEPGAAL
uniref:Uncharacterized protein n=1 Tax=Klebsiella pneumoniae TaxID=573 RepID=A0A8B0T018_KLEPN|nr:hypothetical protein [Klebsiella pneumoniae]